MPFFAGDIVANSGTGSAYSTNTTQTAYDLYLRTALDVAPVIKNFVTVRPERQPHPGDAVVIQKQNHLSQTVINAWKTPLSELEDVSVTALPATTPITLVPAEYGAVVATTRFLERRTLAPFSAYTAAELVSSAQKTIDEIIQDKILAAGLTNPAPAAGVTEPIMFGTAALTWLRDTFTRFNENGVPPWDGEFYAVVLHPRQVNDFRKVTATDGWRAPKMYMNDNLLRLGGELGEYEGFRFFSNPRVRKVEGGTDPDDDYQAYAFGSGALAEAEVSPFSVIIGPPRDHLRRVHSIGWHIDTDYKVFEPLAIALKRTKSTVVG